MLKYLIKKITLASSVIMLLCVSASIAQQYDFLDELKVESLAKEEIQEIKKAVEINSKELQVAISKNDVKMIEYLLENGAIPTTENLNQLVNKNPELALHWIKNKIAKPDHQTLQNFLKRIDYDDFYFFSLEIKAVKYLLKEGIKPNADDMYIVVQTVEEEDESLLERAEDFFDMLDPNIDVYGEWTFVKRMKNSRRNKIIDLLGEHGAIPDGRSMTLVTDWKPKYRTLTRLIIYGGDPEDGWGWDAVRDYYGPAKYAELRALKAFRPK